MGGLCLKSNVTVQPSSKRDQVCESLEVILRYDRTIPRLIGTESPATPIRSSQAADEQKKPRAQRAAIARASASAQFGTGPGKL